MAYLASLAVADVAATTGYILVDKSDTTNYPHPTANPIVVRSVRVDAETEASAPEYIIRIGVLEEVDATNGTTRWFYEARIAVVAKFDEHVVYAGEGISCGVSGGFIGTRDTTNTLFQTDTTIANPTGTNAAPAAGDIVAEIEELSGTGIISAILQVEYETQR